MSDGISSKGDRWTLKNDVEVTEKLQGLLNHLNKRCDDFKTRYASTIEDVKLVDAKVAWANSKLKSLALEKLFEYKVGDEDNTLKRNKAARNAPTTLSFEPWAVVEEAVRSALLLSPIKNGPIVLRSCDYDVQVPTTSKQRVPPQPKEDEEDRRENLLIPAPTKNVKQEQKAPDFAVPKVPQQIVDIIGKQDGNRQTNVIISKAKVSGDQHVSADNEQRKKTNVMGERPQISPVLNEPPPMVREVPVAEKTAQSAFNDELRNKLNAKNRASVVPAPDSIQPKEQVFSSRPPVNVPTVNRTQSIDSTIKKDNEQDSSAKRPTEFNSVEVKQTNLESPAAPKKNTALGPKAPTPEECLAKVTPVQPAPPKAIDLFASDDSDLEDLFKPKKIVAKATASSSSKPKTDIFASSSSSATIPPRQKEVVKQKTDPQTAGPSQKSSKNVQDSSQGKPQEVPQKTIQKVEPPKSLFLSDDSDDDLFASSKLKIAQAKKDASAKKELPISVPQPSQSVKPPTQTNAPTSSNKQIIPQGQSKTRAAPVPAAANDPLPILKSAETKTKKVTSVFDDDDDDLSLFISTKKDTKAHSAIGIDKKGGTSGNKTVVEQSPAPKTKTPPVENQNTEEVEVKTEPKVEANVSNGPNTNADFLKSREAVKQMLLPRLPGSEPASSSRADSGPEPSGDIFEAKTEVLQTVTKARARGPSNRRSAQRSSNSYTASTPEAVDGGTASEESPEASESQRQETPVDDLDNGSNFDPLGASF